MLTVCVSILTAGKSTEDEAGLERPIEEARIPHAIRHGERGENVGSAETGARVVARGLLPAIRT
jgi:hypothetical protein